MTSPTLRSNETKVEKVSEVQETTHSLEIRDLAKSFIINGNRHLVFNRINLMIEPGEFVVIVGESGSGKTTLLRIIAGLETADAGSVAVAVGTSTGSTPIAALCFRNRGYCRGCWCEKMSASALNCANCRGQ